MTPTEVFKNFGGYFQQSNFWSDPIRSISEWICWLLRALANGAYELLNVIYSLSGFISSPAVIEFLNSWKPAFFVAFTLAAIMVGYYLLVNPEKEKPPIMRNILMAVLVITALPTIMILSTNAALSGASAVNSSLSSQTEGDLSYADQIYVNSLTDLKYLSQQGWNPDLTTATQKNDVHYTEQLTNLDINARMWPDQMTDNEKVNEVFYKKPVVDSTGTITDTEDFSTSGMIWQLIPVYYRYNVDYFSLLITLIATILALFFIAYKTARLLWELAAHQFLAIFFATTDFVSGAKTKKVISSIFSILVTIFMTSILLRFYLLGSEYLQSLDINVIVRGFILLFWALACIDGPNILERILGIDAGLKSGWRTAVGMYAAGRAAAHVGKKAASPIYHYGVQAPYQAIKRKVGQHKAQKTEQAVESASEEQKNTAKARNVASGAGTETNESKAHTTAENTMQENHAEETISRKRTVGGYKEPRKEASTGTDTTIDEQVKNQQSYFQKTESKSQSAEKTPVRDTHHMNVGQNSPPQSPVNTTSESRNAQTVVPRTAARRNYQNKTSQSTTKKPTGGKGGKV